RTAGLCRRHERDTGTQPDQALRRDAGGRQYRLRRRGRLHRRAARWQWRREDHHDWHAARAADPYVWLDRGAGPRYGPEPLRRAGADELLLALCLAAAAPDGGAESAGLWPSLQCCRPGAP